MKMTLYPNEPIIVNEGVTFVNFQNAHHYWQWQQALQEEKIVFSDRNQVVAVNKAVQYIGSLEQNIDFDKLYAKTIVTMIMRHLDEEDLVQLSWHDNAIKTHLQQIFLENDLPMQLDPTRQIEQLIKAQQVRIETSNNGSAYDKIIDVVRIMFEFSEQRIIAFNNIHLYLSAEEILRLHEFSVAHGMKILSLGMAASPIKRGGEAYCEIFFDEDFVQFGSD
jgi:CRISPR type II-A-associated protein Csn2